MTTNGGNGAAVDAKGKFAAIVVCWFLGNGCLISWNSMFTIVDYYGYLFPHYHPSRVLTLVYQSFTLGTIAILTRYEATLNTRRRNLSGYMLFFISNLLVVALDLATCGKGGLGPFIGLCAISAAFGIANAHVQGGMLGDLSMMCPEFVQSFTAGLAASGVLSSASRFITKAAFEESKGSRRKGAILFLSICAVLELVCAILYAFVFPKLEIVKYYRSKAASEGSKTVSADLIAGGVELEIDQKDAEDPKELERLRIVELIRQNVDYCVDIYLIHVLTLSIFPGFLVEDTGSHSLGTWYALVLVSAYNVLELIAQYTPSIKRLRINSRPLLTLACLSRFLMIPPSTSQPNMEARAG